MTFSLRRALMSGMVFWFAITGYGIYFLWTLKSAKRINFGIDLVGGTYITLEVQTEKAVESIVPSLRPRNTSLPSAQDGGCGSAPTAR